MAGDEADKHDAAGGAAFLRERARANRHVAKLPFNQWPRDPIRLEHLAFRFEQLATLLEEQAARIEALVAERTELRADIADANAIIADRT